MFNAIGEEAENPGGRSRRISLMNVGVDLGTEQEKRTNSLCIFDAVFPGDVFKDWPVLIWDLQGYRFAENGLHVLSLEWAGLCFEGAMQKEKNQPDVICVTRKKKKVN